MKFLTKLIFIISVCIIGTFQLQAASPENLTYLTEEYPPFNFTEEGHLKGIAVDLLKATWKNMGVQEQTIKVLPWARAYSQVQKVKNTVLFSTTKSKEREKLFKWVGPIKVNRIGLIALKSKNIKINDLSEVFNYNIGTVRDDFSESLLQDSGYILKSKDRVSKIKLNIKKLNIGRIDMFANSVEGAMKLIKAEGLNTDDYDVVWTLSTSALHYAFHLDTPDNLIARFQESLNSLENTRLLLLKKYQ